MVIRIGVVESDVFDREKRLIRLEGREEMRPIPARLPVAAFPRHSMKWSESPSAGTIAHARA